jgi:uncharacterized protein DUF1501
VHAVTRFSRRQAILSTLFGGGYVGLRALATGLPASLLLNPRRALAQVQADAMAAGDAMAGCAASSKAQYIVFNTSGNGDPINASVPGTYGVQGVFHSPDPAMAQTNLMLQGQTYAAAAPWATLPQAVLDRTCFWHIMTNTPVHPKEPDVLSLMDATLADAMLPSILAQQLAPCLGTIQPQPMSIGATSPSEGLTYGGQALPIIPPIALKATLTNPAGPLTNLQPLRDQTLNQLYALYKNGATTAQQAYIDSMVLSQQQVRNINQSLLSQLSAITDNTANSQILAAITLIQMKVTPVVAVHIPFGGDNHHDPNLQDETTQTVSGVATIASLMSQLASAGLSEQVTFMSLNVFGRTLASNATSGINGRQHNPNHQVSVTIGRPFRGGVIGGIAALQGDYGCVAFDASTGTPNPSGNVSPLDSLSAYGQTMLAAVGVPQSVIAEQITGGSVVTGALSS